MTRNPARVAVLALASSALLPCLSRCSSPTTPPLEPPTLPDALLSGMDSDVRRQFLQAYQAAAENPSDPEQSGRVGMLLHAYRHFESAALFYRYTVSGSQPKFRWTYYLGLVEKEAGQPEKAAESFGRALRLRPADLAARHHLATTLIDLNRTEESVPYLQEILKRRPDNPLAHYDLGRAFTKLGRNDDALKSLSRACQLAPDFGAAQYALALAYRDRGERERYERHAALFEKHRDSRPPPDDSLQREVWELRAGVSTLLEKG